MCNVVGLQSTTSQVLFSFLVVLQEIFPQLRFCRWSSDLVGGALLGPGDFRILQSRGLLNLGVQIGLSLLDSFVFNILNLP